jgi:uncharacterized lipoprotein YmbA
MKPALALALGIACAGCAGKVPTTHYYVLEPQDVGRATTQSGLTIGVPPLRVAAPYDQDRIVYRVGADAVEVGFYAYHRWAAPLERMLPTLVAEACRGLSGVQQIEPASAGGKYDAYLYGRVAALEEVDTPSGVRVRVRLELRLERNGVTVWSETTEHETDVEGSDVNAVVRGMAAAIDEAVRAVLPALDAALGQ